MTQDVESRNRQKVGNVAISDDNRRLEVIELLDGMVRGSEMLEQIAVLVGTCRSRLELIGSLTAAPFDLTELQAHTVVASGLERFTAEAMAEVNAELDLLKKGAGMVRNDVGRVQVEMRGRPERLRGQPFAPDDVPPATL